MPKANPIVFFDLALSDVPIGRIKLELYADVTPKTAENFRQFCTGEYKYRGVSIGYKGCPFHRVIPNFMIQGGDFIEGDGSGMMSIYGERFPDENFTVLHDRPGLLSMANSGPNANGCQFFITTVMCPWLDGKHVVFGQVADQESMVVVKKIENVTTNPANGRPKLDVKIVECGEM